jgi:hypothetical protein
VRQDTARPVVIRVIVYQVVIVHDAGYTRQPAFQVVGRIYIDGATRRRLRAIAIAVVYRRRLRNIRTQSIRLAGDAVLPVIG